MKFATIFVTLVLVGPSVPSTGDADVEVGGALPMKMVATSDLVCKILPDIWLCKK